MKSFNHGIIDRMIELFRINEAIKLDMYAGRDSGGNKKGTSAKKIDLSQVVDERVQFSEIFVLDLKRLSRIGLIYTSDY